MKSVLSVLMTFWALAAYLPAGGVDGLSLEEAISLAMKQNPLVLAAEQESAAATGRKLQMTAVPNPEFVFRNEGLSFKRAAGNGNEKETSFGVEQTFEFPGKRALRGEMGRFGEERAELEAERTRLLVAVRVKRAYYRAALSEKSADSLTGSTTLIDRLLENLMVKYRAGSASYSDILRARVEKARLQNQIIEERKEGDQARAELDLLIGRNGDGPVLLTTDIRYAPLVTSLEGAEAAARTARPSLKLAALRRRETETGINLARKGRLPDFSLGLYFPSLRTNAWGFSLGLSVPVWGQKQKGESMEAAAANEIAVISSARDDRRVMSAIGNAFRSARAAEDQVKVFEQRLLRDVEDDLKLSLDNYQLGKIEFFSLLDLYRTYTAARLEHLKAVYQYLLALADLEVAGEEYVD
jgi:outer membrane protein, heavy metal efflux system